MPEVTSAMDTLPVMALVLALAAISGAFLLIKSVRMPATFEKNEEKRKKLTRSLQLRDEKKQETPPEE